MARDLCTRSIAGKVLNFPDIPKNSVNSTAITTFLKKSGKIRYFTLDIFSF